MHTVFALLCFVVVIYWLIFPYPSGLLHWHCCNLAIAPVPAKQPWWIWINASCEFMMNDCITTTKQSTTKPCAYFLGYTVVTHPCPNLNILHAFGFILERKGITRQDMRGYQCWLTHRCRDKMTDIFQTTYLNAFSWIKMYAFRLRFHWSFFPNVHLTICQYWFR